MLTPFAGYLPAGRGPFTSEETTARSRRIRDEAGRYQPGAVLERAVEEGLLIPSSGTSLFRYDITRGEATITGLVGVARAGDLLPHEGTIATAPVDEAPVVEIRPILALVEADLPSLATLGDGVEVIEPDGTRHALIEVPHGALDLGTPVVADGHHRRRSALATRGPDATVLTLVVGSGGAGLEAGTFHRVFAQAGPLPLAASEMFDVEPIAAPEVVEGAMVWLEGGSGRALVLTPDPSAVASLPEQLRGSPAAVAEALLYPLLGLHRDDAEHAGTVEEALIAAAPGGGALLLPPLEKSAVIAAARAGTPLPPKASRFRPKPLRGLVLRPVSD